MLYGNELPGSLGSFQAEQEVQARADPSSEQLSVNPNSLLGAVMEQDASIYSCHADSVPQLSLPALTPEPDGHSWNGGGSNAKEDSDSLLLLMETLLEKSWSLGMDSTELQQWEEAPLSLGAEQELPAPGLGQRPGTKGTSCGEQMLLREGAGESLAFPACHEENSARSQRCSAAPAQPRAPGTRGGSGASVSSQGSCAQPGQQVPFGPAGTVLAGPVSSSKGQPAQAAFQAGAAPPAPGDNSGPTAQSQPGCQLLGSSCPPSLHSNTMVALWHNVPLQENPPSCPSEAWLATAPKELEAAGTHTESQTLPAGNSESPGLWLAPPSQSVPCTESFFSGDGSLHDVEGALPARTSASPGAGQLPGHGSFPRQPQVAHGEPSWSWQGEQAVLREAKWFSQLWLPQAGAAPPRGPGAGLVPHSELLLGPSTDPSAQHRDCTVLPQGRHGQGPFGRDSSFLKDAAKAPLPQQPGALPCPAESHPGAPCSSAGSLSRCSAGKVGAGAALCSGHGSGCPSVPFSAGQPLCACEVQLKVRCEGCRT